MRGSVIKRGNRYSVVVELDRDPVTGKRRREWHSGYRTKRNAEAARVEILGRLQRGEHVAPSKLTLGEYLEERWLPARESQLSPSTYASYASNISYHVVPAIGGARLQGLSADTLTRFYGELGKPRQANGEKRRALSARTRRYVHAIIHKALADALRWDLVTRNVADAASAPSAKAARAPIPTTWTPAELAAFLEGTRETRLGPLWALYAATGLRRAGALERRWSDLDLDAGQLTVGEKGGKSHSIALDAGTVAVLRGVRKRQAAEKLALGPAYRDDGYIFCREDGVRYSPDYITRAFREAVAATELPRIRLHDLRHTWATLALRAGVNPKVVSERLGHYSAAFTLDRYQHVTQGLDQDAAERVAQLLRD